MKLFQGIKKLAQTVATVVLMVAISSQTAFAAPPANGTQFITDAKNLFQSVMNDIYILLVPAAGITFAIIFAMIHFASDDQVAAKRHAWMRRAAIGIVFAYAASAIVNVVGAAFGA
ncbi:hypothetical protein [Alicyclobacillus mengziensis]|uniref:TrbC/VIRB2 family protein n=1 Tax=Alicyclobacillus mengziensis TaxID=2931921 RepID=A0A9X7W4W2_9BACL|nr:hypothetical protein [Alicyclobacillus mengziensis]QSO50108.1 hypothetical protein JZ786_24645 [Alicyclobacillus mengziensis]